MMILSIQFRAKQNDALFKLAAYLPKLTGKIYIIMSYVFGFFFPGVYGRQTCITRDSDSSPTQSHFWCSFPLPSLSRSPQPASLYRPPSFLLSTSGSFSYSWMPFCVSYCPSVVCLIPCYVLPFPFHCVDIYYSKEVKGQRKFFDHFCKYVFTCVNIIFGGYITFFHQGNKLVSHQKFFCVFSVREPSKNYFVISRHQFSSLAYIYMHKYL